MENFIDLNNKFNEIKSLGWVESLGNGNGAIGITFEKLLGKEIENFEIPDYMGIEIKVDGPYKKGNISLFNAVPDSYLFEIKRIHELYGYPDKSMPEFKVFQMPIYHNRLVHTIGQFYFKLYIDRKLQQIKMQVLNGNYELIDDATGWSFEILEEKLNRKLKYLAVIDAEKKKIDGKEYFRYNSINYYKLKDFETFLSLIEKDYIRVIFGIGVYKSGKKLGQIYDHGTTFSIRKYYLKKLYDPIKIDVDNN